HASACARCQALLAAMARTAPPAPTRSWWRSPIITWLVPITAAAAAVLVWVDMSRPRLDRSAQPVPVAARDAIAAGPPVELPGALPSGQPAGAAVGRGSAPALRAPRPSAPARSAEPAAPRQEAKADAERVPLAAAEAPRAPSPVPPQANAAAASADAAASLRPPAAAPQRVEAPAPPSSVATFDRRAAGVSAQAFARELAPAPPQVVSS